MGDHAHNWGTAKHWGRGAVVTHLVIKHGKAGEDLGDGVDVVTTHHEAHGVHDKSQA